MPTYKNNTENIINMLGKNVYPNNKIKSHYYASDNSEVILGTNNSPGTKIKSFEEALTDGDITKTSEDPTWLLIDTTLSSNEYSEWVYIRSIRDVDITANVSSDFDGNIVLQKKYKENEDPVNVKSFTDNTNVASYFYVPTNSYYRVGIENYTAGSADIKVG